MALGNGSGVWTQMNDELATSGTQTFGYLGAAKPAQNFTKSIHVVEGAFSRLLVELSDAPGAGDSRTFELYEDGVATGLTVTISGTDTIGSDLVNSHTVGTIDAASAPILEFKSTVTGTPAASRVRIAMLFTNSNHDYEQVLSGYTGVIKLASATEQIALGGDVEAPIVGTTGAGLWLPNAGTIRSFGVRLDTQTAVAGKDPIATRRFELFKNGSAVAGAAMTFTRGGGNGEIKVAFPDVAYADGDNLLVQSTIVVGTPRASYVSVGVGLSANSDEFFAPYTANQGNLPTGSVSWKDSFVKGFASWTVNASDRRTMGMDWRTKKLRTHVSQLPGGKGETWTIVFPVSLQVDYSSASSQDQTDTTPVLEMADFEDRVAVCTAVSIGTLIKGKLSAALLMEPIPAVEAGAGGTLGINF